MEAAISNLTTSLGDVGVADQAVWTGPFGAPRDPSSRSARIMIVDDEPITIKVVRKYLRQGGYENIVTTSDSAQAIAMVREQCPDIVLLDLMMPEVDGIAILKILRADPQHAQTPVLVLTATDD